MHRWAAHGALAVICTWPVFLHRRVQKPPREFNWIVGVVLLLLTLGEFHRLSAGEDQLAY